MDARHRRACLEFVGGSAAYIRFSRTGGSRFPGFTSPTPAVSPPFAFYNYWWLITTITW